MKGLEKMQCANPSCTDDVLTIWLGMALCEECYNVALQVPDSYNASEMIDIIARCTDIPDDVDLIRATAMAVESYLRDRAEDAVVS